MFTDRSDFLLPNANFAVTCVLSQSCLLHKSYANKCLCERDSHIDGKQHIMFVEGSGKLRSFQYVCLREKYTIWFSLKFFDGSGSLQWMNYIKEYCKFIEILICNDISYNFGKTENKCVMRNFIIGTSYQILFGWSNQVGWRTVNVLYTGEQGNVYKIFHNKNWRKESTWVS
jgi:hypothetical protein